VSETSERPAFYALPPGGWRDYWSLLHPPYTLWHVSYVAIGASLAPRLDLRWLAETMLAFFLAIGLAAHALDELQGRPLKTTIASPVLWAIAAAGLGAAVAIGVHAAIEVTPWMGAFVATGAFLVVAYNLELFGGAFHSDVWFALAWGGFPALTGYFVQAGSIDAAAIIGALSCAAMSAAQRALSAPVRRLRRKVRRVRGELELLDGTRERVDAGALRAAPEEALRWLSAAVPMLAIAMVVARAT
jgi:hypothetical protein